MKKWPIYYKDLLSLGNLQSNIGICTLWTPKENILKKFSSKIYSIGGQLYSKRGINFILRNILANPIIDTIILCGADRGESGKAFMKFIKNGISKHYTVIGDEKCEIDKEIPREFIEKFRKNVKIVDKIDKSVDASLVRQFLRLRKPWAECSIFKKSEFKTSQKYPSEKVTFNVRSNYVWEAWVQILRKIMKFGSKKGMIKVGELRELVNIVAVIEKEDPYNPEMNKVFNFSKRDLQTYYKNFFDKEKEVGSYNYGERIFAYPVGLPLFELNSSKNNKNLDFEVKKYSSLTLDQLEEIYEKFTRYHEDRGLVISLWNPWLDNIKRGWMDYDIKSLKHNKASSKDANKIAGNVPCMILIQFTYRSKKLHLTAYFRSNDMFNAWPLNVFALRKLQFDFALRIGKKPGYLTTISNCAQVYESNYKDVQDIIGAYKGETFCTPDPRSTLIIEVENNEIIVRHMTPDGNEQLNEYRFNAKVRKASLKIMDALLINEVFSNPFQIADIAIELAKAEYCVKNNLPFVQDRDWKEYIR